MGLLLWLILSCVPSFGADTLTFTTRNIVDRDLSLSEIDQANPVQRMTFESFFESDNQLHYKHSRPRVDGYQASLQFLSQTYFDRDALSNYALRPRLDYWWHVSAPVRLRLRADYTHRVRDGNHLFDRWQGQIQWRHKSAINVLTFLTGSIGTTDYNEAVLKGFDQTRYHIAAARRWPLGDNTSYITATISAEKTDAPSARFSAIGYKPSIRFDTRVNDNLRLRAGASHTVRKYGGNFSAADPVRRADARTELSLDVNRKMAWGGALVGGVRWITNKSNIKIRNASGLTGFAGIEFKFHVNR